MNTGGLPSSTGYFLLLIQMIIIMAFEHQYLQSIHAEIQITPHSEHVGLVYRLYTFGSRFKTSLFGPGFFFCGYSESQRSDILKQPDKQLHRRKHL